MSYQTVLDSVYNQATAVTGFTSANVGANDFDVLRSGQGSACVITYDSFTQQYDGMGETELLVNWRFLIGLYVRASGRDATSVSADMNTVRQGFLTRFNSRSKLGGTANIRNALITEGAEADEPLTIGAVSFMYEVLRLQASEDVSVVDADG